jgi:hypothetical protein
MRFRLVRVTLTPGRGEFWSSFTVPLMAPVSLDWEKAKGARRRLIARIDSSLFLK